MRIPFLRIPALALHPHPHPRPRPLLRAFTTSSATLSKQLPPRRPLIDDEIIETFLKGSGPGGQKINKTSSAVQLKHLPTGIVVKCQETRSRALNRKYARRLLQDRIEEAELGDEARTRVKAREKAEKKKSAAKKKRRKYRKLAEGGEMEVEEALESELEEGEERSGDRIEDMERAVGKDTGTRSEDERVGRAGKVG